MKTEILPKDVKAYLIQAAVEIAKETGFCPNSQEQSDVWFKANTTKIGQRALDMQHRLLNMICNDVGGYRGQKKALISVLSAKVWEEVNVREYKRKIAATYAESNRGIDAALAVAA